MGKAFVYIVGGAIVIVMLSAPVRDYISSLFRPDKKELQQEEIARRISRRNPQVEEIQNALKKAGFDPGPTDGLMGSLTRAAIKNFQKKHRLKPTGKIDLATILELDKRKEIEGTSIRIEQKRDLLEKSDEQIQRALKNTGFYKGKIDGKIGPGTKEAVRSFQKAKGLKADGTIGSKTWEALKVYLKDE